MFMIDVFRFLFSARKYVTREVMKLEFSFLYIKYAVNQIFLGFAEYVDVRIRPMCFSFELFHI